MKSIKRSSKIIFIIICFFIIFLTFYVLPRAAVIYAEGLFKKPDYSKGMPPADNFYEAAGILKIVKIIPWFHKESMDLFNDNTLKAMGDFYLERSNLLYKKKEVVDSSIIFDKEEKEFMKKWKRFIEYLKENGLNPAN